MNRERVWDAVLLDIVRGQSQPHGSHADNCNAKWRTQNVSEEAQIRFSGSSGWKFRE